MDVESEFPQLRGDVYKLEKGRLKWILKNFGIKCRDEDSEIEIRAVVKALKGALTKVKTRGDSKRLARLIREKTFLSEEELQANPELSVLQDFIEARGNLYDNAGDEQDSEGIGEHNYEDIGVEKQEGDRVHLTPNIIVVNQDNIVEQNKVTKMAENLPLISAGTYSGLPTENPNDFIDKYQIAAQSNNWSEHTKINLFPAHLVGTALAWYRHYSKGVEVNRWETLKNKFIDSFTPIAQAHSLAVVLEHKIQEKGQPALNYFLEILTLCKRYDPNITDKQIIGHIIQGLQPDICERIVNETNNTLEQLEQNIKKAEVQLQIKNQNRDKYLRVTNNNHRHEQYGRKNDMYSYEDNRDDIRNIQTEIRTLTNIVSNLSIKKDYEGERNKEETSRRQSAERRGTRDERGRAPARDAWSRSPARDTWSRSPARDTWPRSPARDAWTRSPSRDTWSRSPGRRTWARSPSAEGRHGWRSDYRTENDRNQRRDYRQDTGRPAHNPQERRVTFQQQEWRGRSPSGSRNGVWRQEGRRKYCTGCRRDNHDTWECRYRRGESNTREYKKTEYCERCRMNNHSTRDCYKGNKPFQKNV